MIILSSDVYVVEEIYNKTNAYFFKDIEIGDKLIFRTGIENKSSSSSIRASYYTVENVTKGSFTTLSQSNLYNRLKNFGLREETSNVEQAQ